MPRLFLSNAGLEGWIESGHANLTDDRLTLGTGEAYRLVPAVHFEGQVSGLADFLELLGKVKTHPQLEEMQAEHYLDSVIIGEVGYKVLEGYLGEAVAP